MKMKFKSKKRKWLVIILLILIILAVIAVIFFSIQKKKFQTLGTNVRAAQTMTIEKTINSEGEVQSSLEENIAPHTSYYLKKINVGEGDALSEGDKILTYSNGKTLTAPYDCVVESWYLPESGARLTTDHYVTIAGTDVMMMELSVSEEDVAIVKKGQSARVTVEATGSTYEGEVSYVSEVGTYSGGTSTFKAKVEFNNDGDVKLGMTGKAVISLAKAENVLGVPTSAVHSNGNGSFVTVAKDDEGKNTSEVQVETGLSNDSYIAIVAGLKEGTKVVVPESDNSSSGFRFPGSGSGDPPSGGFSGGGFGGSGGPGGPPSDGLPGGN